MEKRLAVILGAGSSYDCVTPNVTEVDTDYRPPLTKDLFAYRASFNVILRHYPKAEAVADSIRTQLRAGQSLEALLRSFADTQNRFLRSQYYAIPLYLQELLGEVSAHYVKAGATKFDTLVRSIEQSLYDRVLFLTLNYDLFLETALRRMYFVNLSRPDHYVGAGFKWSLVKLHGSVNWGKKVMNPVPSSSSSEALDHLSNELHLDSEVRVLKGWKETERLVDNSLYYPAITVPLEGKDEFVCPETHSKVPADFLKDCADFLMIGFSGIDQHVLGLLKSVTRVEKVKIVNGLRHLSVETLNRLIRINGAFSYMPKGIEDVALDDGFAGFVDSGQLDSFLHG